jgi:hypothetical protein
MEALHVELAGLLGGQAEQSDKLGAALKHLVSDSDSTLESLDWSASSPRYWGTTGNEALFRSLEHTYRTLIARSDDWEPALRNSKTLGIDSYTAFVLAVLKASGSPMSLATFRRQYQRLRTP